MAAKRIKNSLDVIKTRKQLRKEKRKDKKAKRNEYYMKRNKPKESGLLKNNVKTDEVERQKSQKVEVKKGNKFTNNEPNAEQVRQKEKKQQLKLQEQMMKKRSRQLQDANLLEDQNIKKLEKQLKLNKRKSKNVPASFSRDGLDYLLEVCDPENLKSSALAEQQLAEVNDEFEEDLVLMTESNRNKKTKKQPDDELSETEEEEDDGGEEEEEGDGGEEGEEEEDADVEDEENLDSDFDLEDSVDGEEEEEEEEMVDDEVEEKRLSRKRPNSTERDDKKKSRTASSESDLADEPDDDEEGDDNLSGHGDDEEIDNSENEDNSPEKKKDDGTWEDIYGRLRTKDGLVVTEKIQKYVCPAARMRTEEDLSADKLRIQNVERLRKQLNGLMNKISESNMHGIATQIEELYMSNSRHDMNYTITNLIMKALVLDVLATERSLMEHVVLIVILHANVGTEVGAHFLQTVVKQFDNILQSTTSVEDKKLDNIIVILAQLYNFKLFDSKLIYEIIDKLADSFDEKDVECILHILRNVGFNLRKDNPLALKNLILSLQKKAANASDETKDNSRVKFMLDILLAVKNNNVTKVPNYDTTYSEHLKKIMKNFIRKGNYVTQLNISLEDLLKAEEKGKWWVVGSAWTGNAAESDTSNVKKTEKSNTFSKKLLELAAKQRMNTDAKKNIFCAIMSAEDYLDAFEKLLRLALKNQQEREIIHVILHCCLQEKAYNPYYAALAQKFCEYDRKFQMTIKYSIWDKLKILKDHSATQISHLAKLLSHLFLEKGLPISTLKIVQFSELDKVTLRFIRQILLGILLHDDLEVCKGVFDKVGLSDKLKMFRESLRLFLYHFLLKNLKSQGIAEDKKELLQQRVKVVEKLLMGKQKTFDL